MEDNRETGDTLFDFFKNIETQWRGFFTLFELELESTMAGADGNGQRINTGLLDKILDLFGLGVS